MTGFQINQQALAKHANDLNKLMAALPDATRAGSGHWDPQTFGVLGIPFANKMSSWTDTATACMDAVKEKGDSVVVELRAMQISYQNADQAAKREMDKIMKNLEQKQWAGPSAESRG